MLRRSPLMVASTLPVADPTLRSVDGPPPPRAMLSSRAGTRGDARGGRPEGCARRRV